MLSAPMLDPMGTVIVRLRDALAADYTDRVRGMEPGPGDVQPAGSYRRFVVLVMLDDPPDPFLPIQRARIGFRCYGTDPHDAAVLYGATVQALHDIGPEIASSGLGIYKLKVETGGTADKDPDTQQPVVTGVLSLIATAQAVA